MRLQNICQGPAENHYGSDMFQYSEWKEARRLWPVTAHLPNTTSMPERMYASFPAGSFPARSVNSDLSIVTIWETLATESFGSPESRLDNAKFPGAFAQLWLLVRGTQTTVAIWLPNFSATLTQNSKRS